MIVLPPPADMSNVDIVESHVHSRFQHQRSCTEAVD